MSISQFNAPDAASDLLRQLRCKGVVLWADNGALRYRAPKGAIGADEVSHLRANRQRMLALLSQSDVSPRQLRGSDRAPLTPQQLAHWRLHGLAERPSVRQIAGAIRLSGPLQVDLLRSCFSMAVMRHDALRTRVVLEHGTPVQIVDAEGRVELTVCDLASRTGAAAEESVKQLLDEMILQPVRVGIDSLLAARLIKLRGSEHMLLIAMEHLISDAVSLNLLVRDVLQAYRQMAAGLPVVLPTIRRSFIEHALEHQRVMESLSPEAERYWSERLQGFGRLSLPTDGIPMEGDPGWGSVPVLIDPTARARLLEWSRRQRTTLVMSVFTAFTTLVLRWCGMESGVVRYQTDGRFEPSTENTIGYFASVLPLRVKLCTGDRFSDVLKRVTDEFVSAHDHHFSCDVDARVPRPDYMHNSGFNWVANGMPTVAVNDGLVTEARPFSSPILRKVAVDGEPSLLFYDTVEGAFGEVLFPRRRFSELAMKRFAKDLSEHLHAMQAESDPMVEHVKLNGPGR